MNNSITNFSVIQQNSRIKNYSNQFVGYLNSLQRFGGSNESALAESQACNAQFPSIHVIHPLTKIIMNELSAVEGKHVILTGHAGDGKSTIALELFKQFSGIPVNQPLKNQLKSREDVASVSIIKDLSERNKTYDSDLIQELITKQRRFLLVSNTGTLLDLIKDNSNCFSEDRITLESHVLDAISTEDGESILELGDVRFRVFNLAQMDNLGLAELIFRKMLAFEQWIDCQKRSCNEKCPIYRNVNLIQKNQSRIIERIFLAYRRMYEYGIRLTIRQITEHLSYMITSGLEEVDVLSMQKESTITQTTEYLFFNRFFGDNGCQPHLPANEMKSVQIIRSQGFGERPSSRMEHQLWMKSTRATFELGIELLAEDFEELHRQGSRETIYKGISPNRAREQVRRMIYFLYTFKEDEKDYLGQFLNSTTLLNWQSWQTTALSFIEKTTLEQKIYHVVQEHFTGIRLPEGSTKNDRRLYVTLNRRRNEVRQSAQVVLAQVDWSTSTTLKLIKTKSASGVERQELVLCGKDRIDGIDLLLTVPFLDYVIMRHYGEIGEVLEASYLERLNRFKAQVHNQAADENDDRIMVVRLRTDHTFHRQNFAVNGSYLEVTDVL